MAACTRGHGASCLCLRTERIVHRLPERTCAARGRSPDVGAGSPKLERRARRVRVSSTTGYEKEMRDASCKLQKKGKSRLTRQRSGREQVAQEGAESGQRPAAVAQGVLDAGAQLAEGLVILRDEEE